MDTTFIPAFKNSLFDPAGFDFGERALALFRFQAAANPIYRKYLALLGVDPVKITAAARIPFLPIEFFKHHAVACVPGPPTEVFESSGTTGQVRSRHLVFDPPFYLRHARRLFEHAYGPLSGYHVLALLPSYVERTGSSLAYMAADFIRGSGSPESGFWLHDLAGLAARIDVLSRQPGRKVLLLGVTFALLDLAERFGGREWPGVLVMETGGMKGRRRELLREEVHETLQAAFGLPAVHSEYGMTELLSQAYAPGGGVFRPGPALRIHLRDLTDPLSADPRRRTGGINVIDLANADTCAFIETQDIGALLPDGNFQVLGRADNSDMRGCNLLVAG